MTWGYVAVGVGTAIGGIYSADKAGKTADKASKRALQASTAAGDLMQTGYREAEGRLSPFMASESAANKQLMIEMGLTPDYSEQIGGSTSRLEELRAELEGMGVTVGEDGGGSFKDRLLDTKKDEFRHSLSPSSFFRSRSKKKKAKKKAKAAAKARQQKIEGLAAQIEEEEGLLAGYQQQQDQPAGTPGTAYMETPAYQATIDQGVAAVDQGAATGGALYSGARGEALKDVGQGVQQSYYNNYMNILQGMANPTSTTNLSNIGINQAGTIGAQNIAAQQQSSAYNLIGQEAQGAAMSDIFGGISSGISAYMNRPQTPPPPQVPPQATQTSAIPASSSAWM